MSEHDRLAEIRARMDAATLGPWGWNSYNGVYSGPLIQADARLEAEHEAAGAPWDEDGEPSGEWRSRFADVAPRVCSVPPSYGDTATGRHAADAQFIAHARADIPWLLEQLAAQTARIKALEAAGEGILELLTDHSHGVALSDHAITQAFGDWLAALSLDYVYVEPVAGPDDAQAGGDA